nr:helicase [Tanacetum cinerariifolium]
MAKSFRMAKEWRRSHGDANFGLRLLSERTATRQYNAPTVSEVSALIINDFGDGLPIRDIVVNKNNTGPQRILELHPSYMALQYPLLFLFGSSADRPSIPTLANMLNKSIFLTSNTNIGQDGKIHSYCGLRLVDIPATGAGTSSASKYVYTRVSRRPKGVPIVYHNLGPPSHQCSMCNAIMWYNERSEKSRKAVTPSFSLCFQDGTWSVGRDVWKGYDEVRVYRKWPEDDIGIVYFGRESLLGVS